MTERVFTDIDLSELIGGASITADEWLEAAIRQTGYYFDGEETDVQHAGFMIAAAIAYHADRQTMAAETIAHALLQLGKANGNG